MKKVDLHIHTVATVSDHYFEFSMDTLQSYVECKELDAIAVTNHNLFDRKQYEEICEKISVPVFPGIEIDVEQGHLLLITSPDDLDDFEPRCKHIQEKNSTNTSWISEDDLLEYFPTIGKYVLIPHYDKSPKLELHRIPKIKDHITCGEVTSVKKFISMKKRSGELVPILFSDERMENREAQFPDRQTFIDIEELSINALKHALRDRAKVSLSPDEGNVLFQILDNGLQISTGLTVVLGGRSSGKSYTLDAINDQYEHAAYIRQFELLARDEEADKRRFDELLRRKGDSITQEFLQPFRNVIDNVQAVDLRADERAVSYTHLYKIITQVFLYKYLSDKFGYEASKVEPSIAQTENVEAALTAMSDEDYEMMLMMPGGNVAKLKKNHYISYLFNHQNDDSMKKADGTPVSYTHLDVYKRQWHGLER